MEVSKTDIKIGENSYLSFTVYKEWQELYLKIDNYQKSRTSSAIFLQNSTVFSNIEISNIENLIDQLQDLVHELKDSDMY